MKISARSSELSASAAMMIGPVGIVLVAVALVYLLGDDAIHGVTVLGLIDVVLVVGLYVFVGNTGILSLGQMSFMGVGAYISGALTIPLQMRHVLLPSLPGPLATYLLADPIAILIGGLIATLCALVVAIPLMRLSGLAAGIATLAVLQITEIVASNWDAMTGGAASMPGVPRTTNMGTAAIAAVLVIAVAFLFQISRFGVRLRASRDDEGAALSIGINVYWHRVLAFVVSAFIVGIGGGLYVHYLGTFSPESFYLGVTFITLAMLVIGGTNSLMGAVLGAVIISAVSEGLIRMERAISVPNLHEIGLAILMLVILIVRPSGIMAGREFRWRALARRPRSIFPRKLQDST